MRKTANQFSAFADPVQAAGDNAALLAAVIGHNPDFSPGTIRGVYLHIPFCFHKCHYCDFYSIVDSADRQGQFVRRMVGEIRALTAGRTIRPQTFFVGGGTPSLLAWELWETLLATLRTAFDLSGLREFTVECNPETVTQELLRTLAGGGVNRLSFGAQSFNPTHLKTLERWHDPANVGRAVGMARKAGLSNLNLDLIFAIPGQSLAQWREDLRQALDLEPTHISC